MTERIEKVIKNLNGNNINAVYCKTKEEIVKYVENLLPKKALITSGGSMSLVESGIWDLINKPISVRRLVSLLREEYDVSEDECLEGVKDFLHELHHSNLLNIH